MNQTYYTRLRDKVPTQYIPPRQWGQQHDLSAGRASYLAGCGLLRVADGSPTVFRTGTRLWIHKDAQRKGS